MTVTLAVVGAGQRGTLYARLAHELGAKVVAVAEPDAAARARFVAEHGLAPGVTFGDWRDLFSRPRLADAVAICTQDRDHVAPAVAAAAAGYDLLVEKPMATDEQGAEAIVAAVREAGVISGVCHVLRFTAYTQRLKALVTRGAIGRIVSVQHLEPIGWWHFAHSFVRGNWRREADTSPMLAQKSVHDIDWIGHIVDEPVTRVASFGSLLEFRPENAPAGAAGRCLDCAVRGTCPFDAVRLYQGFLNDPDYHDWPVTVVTPDPTPASLAAALREGPYGECVYAGHNDVVDHQVVTLEFPSGANATFSAVAFTEMAHRKTRLFGTRGWLEGDGMTITVHDFVTDTYQRLDTNTPGVASGHGGGDEGLMRAFLRAVAERDQSAISSDVAASLDSLRVVWAAERARHAGTVETIV